MLALLFVMFVMFVMFDTEVSISQAFVRAGEIRHHHVVRLDRPLPLGVGDVQRRHELGLLHWQEL